MQTRNHGQSRDTNEKVDQIVDLTHEIYGTRGLHFDPELVSLKGVYIDQISAYRARRGWGEALERCFLLEKNQDFEIKVKSDFSKGEYTLECVFNSACARYAFWRLTHDQAPEAQYLIETAHIPESETLEQHSVIAPDLQGSTPAMDGNRPRRNTLSGTMLRVLRDLVKL